MGHYWESVSSSYDMVQSREAETRLVSARVQHRLLHSVPHLHSSENLISLPFCLDNHLRKRRRERARACQLSNYSPFSFPKVPSVKGPASSSAQMPVEPGEPSQLGNPFREIEETLCYDLPVLWPTYSLLRLLFNRAKKPLLPQTLVSGDSSCLLR